MSRVEDAAEKIRELILSGEFQPGAALAAAELAPRLNMSRTPVREALLKLVNEGLVEAENHKMARVADWTIERINEVFELRLSLEPLACKLAAQLITPSEVDELKGIAVEIQRLGDPGPRQDLSAVQDLNFKFHNRIVELSKNTALCVAMTGVMHASLITRTRAEYTEEEQRRSSQHHLEIVAALEGGSGDWAESVMKSHLIQGHLTMLRAKRKFEEREQS